jgi:hypothetical protein
MVWECPLTLSSKKIMNLVLQNQRRLMIGEGEGCRNLITLSLRGVQIAAEIIIVILSLSMCN